MQMLMGRLHLFHGLYVTIVGQPVAVVPLAENAMMVRNQFILAQALLAVEVGLLSRSMFRRVTDADNRIPIVYRDVLDVLIEDPSFLALQSAIGSHARPPTIVQVVADDLGYNDWGFANGNKTHPTHQRCSGGSQATTPTRCAARVAPHW